MRIAIIYNSQQPSWIIEKFALKLKENLLKLNFECEIFDDPREDYDINHHVFYGEYKMCRKTVSTFMITHIDSERKLLRLKQLLDFAENGICMSKDTVNWLIRKGISSKKISYILPAHDEDLEFKKTSIGLFSNIYKDGRKNQDWLIDILKIISNDLFEFVIVGIGWDEINDKLVEAGFKTTYIPFSKEEYTYHLKKIDYWLNMGFDEGSMCFLDIMQLGKKSITSVQGFQKDFKNAVDFPFNNKEELLGIFSKLNSLQKAKRDYSADLNWLNFTKKHLDMWEYLLNKKEPENISYIDGLNYYKSIKDKKLYAQQWYLTFKVLMHKFLKRYNLK